MLFQTVNGSSYEVDQENKKIRRLSGSSNPTNRQGKDGDWKTFFNISPIVEGKGVVIFWVDADPLAETLEQLEGPSIIIPITYTSDVAKIINE